MNLKTWESTIGIKLLAFIVGIASITAGSNYLMAQADFLITSPNNDTVERYDAATGDYLGAFVTAGSGGLDGGGGVAVGPDDHVYVTSSLTNQVLRYDGETGAFIDVFASGNGLTAPNNIVFHQDYMYVGQFTGGGNGSVQRYNATTGAFVDDFLDIDFVDGFAFIDDTVLVSNFGGGVSRFDLNDGSFIDEFASAGEGGLLNPTAILGLDNGDVLISSYGANAVKRFDSDGNFLGNAIDGLTRPEGLAIGPDGKLYAGSYTQGIVNRYDAETFAFEGEFINHGPVTNFFTFRTNAVPEPSASIPMLIASLSFLARRKRVP